MMIVFVAGLQAEFSVAHAFKAALEDLAVYQAYLNIHAENLLGKPVESTLPHESESALLLNNPLDHSHPNNEVFSRFLKGRD